MPTPPESPLVEGAQALRTAVEATAAHRLAHVPVRLEGRDDGVDIAARVSTQVRRDGVRHGQPGVGLEEG